MDYTGEIKLSSEEDAPMTMAVDRKVSTVAFLSLPRKDLRRGADEGRERTW